MVDCKSRIQITVEISGSSYGHTWSMKDITEQSGKEAVAFLRNKLADNQVAIIGDPKVLVITTMIKD
jgi:O6-methylguanine-DNA--protein-cysteine methyltransferase